MSEGKPTWAAVLLFSKTPQKFLTQGAVHCGRFKESTVVLDDRLVQGSIIDQIEEALEFIRKNIHFQFLMTGEPARQQVWDYPLEAIREALSNAICHRDYTIPSNVEIRIFDDQLIVWSPGRLPYGLKVQDLLKPHSSTLRNKSIAGVFYDLGLIEQWGSGIDVMRQTCLRAGMPEPAFEEDQGFRVTFKRPSPSSDLKNSSRSSARRIKSSSSPQNRKRTRRASA